MTNGQVFAVILIVMAAYGLWLESQCKLFPILKAIGGGASFAEFLVALVVFMAVLSLVGEPYSTWFAALVLLSMFVIDHRVNGKENIWHEIGVL